MLRATTFLQVILLASLSLFLFTCNDKSSAPVECTIDVLSPVSDAVFAVGDSVLVSWHSWGSCHSSLDVELWSDDSLIATLAQGVTGTGEITWIADGYDLGVDSNFTIRVIDAVTGVYDSSGPFIVSSGILCRPTIREPSPEDVWLVGEEHWITWKWIGLCDKSFRVDLMKGGEVIGHINTFYNLYDPDKGYGFLWTVDDFGLGLGFDYSIKVTYLSTGISDESAPFAIGNDSCIVIFDPLETDSVMIGDTVTAHWSATADCYDDLTLCIIRDEERRCEISTGLDISGTDSFATTWCIGNSPANDYKFRLYFKNVIAVGESEVFNLYSLDTFAVRIPDSNTVWRRGQADVEVWWWTKNLEGSVEISLVNATNSYLLAKVGNGGVAAVDVPFSMNGGRYQVMIHHVETDITAISDTITVQ